MPGDFWPVFIFRLVGLGIKCSDSDSLDIFRNSDLAQDRRSGGWVWYARGQGRSPIVGAFAALLKGIRKYALYRARKKNFKKIFRLSAYLAYFKGKCPLLLGNRVNTLGKVAYLYGWGLGNRG